MRTVGKVELITDSCRDVQNGHSMSIAQKSGTLFKCVCLLVVYVKHPNFCSSEKLCNPSHFTQWKIKQFLQVTFFSTQNIPILCLFKLIISTCPGIVISILVKRELKSLFKILRATLVLNRGVRIRPLFTWLKNQYLLFARRS